MASIGRSKGLLLAATLSAAIMAGLFVFSRKSSLSSVVPSITTLPAFVPTETRGSSRLLVVTRIHVSSAHSLSPPSAVTSFAKSALEYADNVLICVGSYKDGRDIYLADLASALSASGITNKTHVLLIDPWGGFTHALNLAVSYAVDNNFQLIGFQSLETTMTKDVVSNLVKLFNDRNTLVVGPALEGHEFKEGVNLIRGRTCPWNTFALWDLSKLAIIGFPLIGNGYTASIAGGVEEVTAVSFAQFVHPTWTAWLVDTGAVNWKTTFTDPARAEWHRKKMESKDARPAAQMKAFGIPMGTVAHVSIDKSLVFAKKQDSII